MAGQLLDGAVEREDMLSYCVVMDLVQCRVGECKALVSCEVWQSHCYLLLPTPRIAHTSAV